MRSQQQRKGPLISPAMIELTKRIDVREYLAQRSMRVTRVSNGWAQLRCPFHKAGEEKNPSFTVNLSSGGFFCHACKQHGGDLIALHQQLTGAHFAEAVRELARCA